MDTTAAYPKLSDDDPLFEIALYTQLMATMLTPKTMVFTNNGFAWGAGANWDCGPLVASTKLMHDSQITPGAAFCAPGSLSGTIKFIEPGLYDISWLNSPTTDPNNSGYLIGASGAGWAGAPSGAANSFAVGTHYNGQTYYENHMQANGIRIPTANLEIRFTGVQSIATTNTPYIRIAQICKL